MCMCVCVWWICALCDVFGGRVEALTGCSTDEHSTSTTPLQQHISVHVAVMNSLNQNQFFFFCETEQCFAVSCYFITILFLHESDVNGE